MIKQLIIAIILVASSAAVVTTVVAAPLPDGTVLSITPGNIPPPNAQSPCTTGSCFSMQLSATLPLWTNIEPGTDGGIIIGKDQLPGGQEGPDGGTVITPGELTAAWEFFNNMGSNATAPFSALTTSVTTGASANVFDDESCTGADGCLNKTVLGSWHVAWNGIAVPMGSALGCQGNYPDWCKGVTEWTLTDSGFILRYAWVVPSGDPSGFGNIPYTVILRGGFVPPPLPLPTLVSPADGVQGLGSSVEFRWKKSTDATSYHVYNCADDPTASCAPETMTVNMNSKGLFYAGGGGLLLIGMTFFGGLKGRKMITLLFVIAVVFAGGTLISCSNSKTSDETISPLPVDQMSHMVQGLSPNTIYYWKVVADDGSGGTAGSAIQSFTTQ
jgi:hypothetical protein